MEHFIIFYQYTSIKKVPKFQYWITGAKSIIIDHHMSKQVGVDPAMYTRTLTTARTLLINTGSLDKMKKDMSKYFENFEVYHHESLDGPDTKNFNHMLYSNFENRTII